jgi:peptide-methionine (R)-S-oxide reductase
MKRRTLLTGLVAAPVLGLTARGRADDVAAVRNRWRELARPGLALPDPSDTVRRSADAWRRMLGDAEFAVLREADTEPAFSSPLDAEQRAGLYLCAGCGLALFSSEMKFDSGTGWPSFFTTIPDVFETQRDWVAFLPRTEYHCVRCGGHHGHVFDDGPEPTGQRWCNNGVALDFSPRVAA